MGIFGGKNKGQSGIQRVIDAANTHKWRQGCRQFHNDDTGEENVYFNKGNRTVYVAFKKDGHVIQSLLEVGNRDKKIVAGAASTIDLLRDYA